MNTQNLANVQNEFENIDSNDIMYISTHKVDFRVFLVRKVSRLENQTQNVFDDPADELKCVYTFFMCLLLFSCFTTILSSFMVYLCVYPVWQVSRL